ncbi:MAG: DUF2779 domain-containing protein [Bacteroidetes bacterium]|nr:MAG: DUF2779 domain-containing protein [Bacteroidota bacterium]REK35295.1 MAG: DUF2779 domain-containing protein [Bacteroidota bacterium]REK48375.1 MAG: DUF2779 domain-containing protein [Bacteroidota bacterium]
MTKHVLSKSTFVYGCQCPKRLFLHKFKPELKPKISEARQAIFDTGTDVGLLAQKLFPGGVDASPESTYEYQKSVLLTKDLIRSGVKIIYEAAFQHEGVLAAIDILVKNGNKWEAYEVKSSTQIKEVNITDASLQYHVITGSGISLKDISIIHINNEYVRKGRLNISKLFRIESVLKDVLMTQDIVEKKIRELKKLLKNGVEPEVDIGPHCSDPYECEFTDHCWSHIPSPSVFDVSRLRESRKFELYEEGTVKLEDLNGELELTAYQEIQINSYLSGKKHINKKGVREFLSGISYPLYFLDFESFQTAVPLFNKSRPFQQIPFQYSLHYKKDKSSDLSHNFFLADGQDDPRPAFIEKLLKDTTKKGDILTYNIGFEKSIVNKLAEDFPQYQSAMTALSERMKDLMTPFRNGDYYHPSMNGSYSIKKVLPALVPEMDYDKLEISEGEMAGIAFRSMMINPDADRKKIRADLLEYCKTDTLAMVKILEVLETV